MFAVGLRFYGRDGHATTNALSHVNIYCDGARVLSAGYDPTTPGAVYPQLGDGLVVPPGDTISGLAYQHLQPAPPPIAGP